MSIFKKKEPKQEFIDAYAKVVEKHGYDLQATGFFTQYDGKLLPAQRIAQFNKEFQQFLEKRKVYLHFSFNIVKHEKSDAK